MTSPADTELVARARAGDDHAYGELVRRHQAIALRVAVTVAGREVDAEVAVQEAFVKAYNALGRFRDDAPFRPWLLAIVGNEARNLRRSETRRRQATGRLALATESQTADAPDTRVLDAEDHAHLARALNDLPERDRQILTCRFLLDLDEAETAHALAIARGTVKSRQSRALRRLRDLLREEALHA